MVNPMIASMVTPTFSLKTLDDLINELNMNSNLTKWKSRGSLERQKKVSLHHMKH